MKKMWIYVIITVLIILLGVFIGNKIIKNKETKPVNAGKQNETLENKTEEKKDDKQNETINNEIGNNTTSTNENNSQEVEKPEEEPKTDLEKAIYIVKKDWGKDDNVYFAEDGTTANGEYIICVRNKNTTNALNWYTVNVETGKFEKE